MNKIHTWLHGRWAVPAISGVAMASLRLGAVGRLDRRGGGP